MIPTTTIRAAVNTVYAGFVTGARVAPDDWDHAVSTLAGARTQLGGAPRHLISRLFLDSGTYDPVDLAGVIAALVDHLDTHLPDDPSPPALRTDPPEPCASDEPPDDPGGQLRFFNP